MDLSIFRSYDIRGENLDKETAFKIGQAFVQYTGTKRVVIGRDMRLSSPELFDGLSKGIISQGADVYNIGLVPTEGVYFAVGHYGYETGIMITASHNPKEYNGFKLIRKNGDRVEFIRGKDLIDVVENDYKEAEGGKVEEIDIWSDYINHIFSFIGDIEPFKVVVDAGNGMAGKVIPLIQDRLPLEIIPLNFELDGSFPAHPSNPLLKESSSQICEEVKKQKADFGFIFDGDADRIFLIDEKGNFKKGDVTILLLAEHLLKKNPGKAIIYNLVCSKAVPEFIKKWGGVPIKIPVGAVNIMNAIDGSDGIMGGEVSGHYSFRDSFTSDSGFIAFLLLLEVISKSGKKVSELTNGLSPYFKNDEMNFECDDKERVMKLVSEKYFDGKQDCSDGITVEYNDWWFNLRPSNTEPLLRLTIEADTKDLLEKKTKELSKLF